MQDFWPHMSESNHRYYFPSPQSLTGPHKTRILHSDEYTIYIKDFFGSPLNQNLCLCCVLFCFVCFSTSFLSRHCIWYCSDTWHNSFYQEFTSSICFCAILFWIWDLNTSATIFTYLHSFGLFKFYKCTWILSYVNTEWSNWDVSLFPFLSSLGQTFQTFTLGLVV